MLLNNLNVSAEYMERLAQDARPEVEAAIWKNPDHDIKIATKALDDLASASSKFRKLLQVNTKRKDNIMISEMRV